MILPRRKSIEEVLFHGKDADGKGLPGAGRKVDDIKRGRW